MKQQSLAGELVKVAVVVIAAIPVPEVRQEVVHAILVQKHATQVVQVFAIIVVITLVEVIAILHVITHVKASVMIIVPVVVKIQDHLHVVHVHPHVEPQTVRWFVLVAGHPVLLAVTLIAEVFVPTIVLIRVLGQQAKHTIFNIFIH